MVLTLGTVASTIEIAIIVMADLAKYLAGIGGKTTHSITLQHGQTQTFHGYRYRICILSISQVHPDQTLNTKCCFRGPAMCFVT